MLRLGTYMTASAAAVAAAALMWASPLTPVQADAAADPRPQEKTQMQQGAQAAGGQKGQALELLDRGEIAFVSQNYDRARSLWQQALEARPGWDKARMRLDDMDQRRKRYEARLARISADRQAKLAMVEGVTQFNQGNYSRAAELFRAYADEFPNRARGREYLELAMKWRDKTAQGM